MKVVKINWPTFDNVEEAEEYFQKYANEKGFTVIKGGRKPPKPAEGPDVIKSQRFICNHRDENSVK